MRRLSPAFLVPIFLALIGGTAAAQIVLVPGPQTLVSRAPKFIASADFNKDGIQDAAVTNTTSSRITILFGARDGSFSSVIDAPVGRTLRGIAAGDINSDGKADIAVADFIDGRIFTVTGNGDGTLNRPASFKVGIRPIDVAIGDFDGKNGLDLVSANQTANKASVLLNLGGSRGFTPLGDLDLGKRPKRIDAADLNGDGFDDIIAVNTGTQSADDVTVLLNTGVGSFKLPINFVVGAGAEDLIVKDLDNDGVPDMLVLNTAATSVANEFSVSVLINQTETIDGQAVGTGLFNVLTPVTLRCPSTINGILIQCSPNFLAAGDFDGDGFIDFAVSFFTRPVSGTTTTPGLIEAYAGHGDGTFDFSTQVAVGFDPEGIVAADFTGDGIPDIAVAEQGSRTVRVVSSLPPTPRGIGDPCTSTKQCEAGLTCVDNVCCTSASCPTGQFCNIKGSAGTCHQPGANGSPCTVGQQCTSGNCVDSTCCSVASCPSGQFCNTGECAPPGPNSTQCNDNSQCSSGFCVGGFCCGTPSCPSGEVCNTGQCAPPAPNGTSCLNGSQCLSGNCVDRTCCGSPSCPAGQFCTTGQCKGPGDNGTRCNDPVQCLSGFCVSGFCCSTPSCPAGSFCNTGDCAGPADLGTPCSSPLQCLSNFCVNGVCCSTPSCPEGQLCNIPFLEGTCNSPAPNGSPCTDGAQCVSGFCTDGVCCGVASCPTGQSCDAPGFEGQCAPAPTRTPSPTRTPAPQPTGKACDSGDQCVSTFCVDHVCCGVPFCPDGQACNVSGREGQCSIKPTPTPKPNGIPCVADEECLSGHCTDGACCASASCPAGQFCNISGSAGQCHLPLPQGNGSPCTDNAACISGFCTDNVCCSTASCPAGEFCNVQGKAGQCALLPTPTRTPSPAPTKAAPASSCSSGDDCESGFCTDGVCCDTDLCPDDERCDILNFGGTCSPPLPVGDECEKNSDCELQLLCLPDITSSTGFRCSVPPTPTPTQFPVATKTPPLVPIVQVSRGGGCSISRDGDAAGAWLLAILPLVIWVRRYRLARPARAGRQ